MAIVEDWQLSALEAVWLAPYPSLCRRPVTVHLRGQTAAARPATGGAVAAGAAPSDVLRRSFGLGAAILREFVRSPSGPPLRVASQRLVCLACEVGCVLLGCPPVATAAAGLLDRSLLGLVGRGFGLSLVGRGGGQRFVLPRGGCGGLPPSRVGAARRIGLHGAGTAPMSGSSRRYPSVMACRSGARPRTEAHMYLTGPGTTSGLQRYRRCTSRGLPASLGEPW
jgi:hypothetical protein